MNKEIIKRNMFWLFLSTLITLLFSNMVWSQKKDEFSRRGCNSLPYEISYQRELEKVNVEDILEKNINIPALAFQNITNEDLYVEDYCYEVFQKILSKNFIKESVFNILQLWILMSMVSNYVLKYEKKG